MRRGIRTKVVALAVASIAVTGTAMVGVSAWQSGRFADDARVDVQELVGVLYDRLVASRAGAA